MDKRSMRTHTFLLAAIGAVLVLYLGAKVWFNRQEAAVIRSVTNIDLSSDARLVGYSDRSTRFGAEGTRLWKFTLTPSYAARLRRTCEGMGYSLTDTKSLLAVNPFLSPHLDRDKNACVRRIRSYIYGISVIQGNRLIVSASY